MCPLAKQGPKGSTCRGAGAPPGVPYPVPVARPLSQGAAHLRSVAVPPEVVAHGRAQQNKERRGEGGTRIRSIAPFPARPPLTGLGEPAPARSETCHVSVFLGSTSRRSTPQPPALSRIPMSRGCKRAFCIPTRFPGVGFASPFVCGVLGTGHRKVRCSQRKRGGFASVPCRLGEHGR